MSRTGATFPLLLACLLALAGCAGSGNPPTAQGTTAATFPMAVKTCGRNVTIKRPPERVMTVGAEAPTLMWGRRCG